MNTRKKGWLESRSSQESFRRAFAREDAIENFLTVIEEEMVGKGVSRKQLAGLMNCRPANITRIMKRTANLTAATMVDLAWALGLKVCFVVKPQVQQGSRGDGAQVIKVDFSRWESWLDQEQESMEQGCQPVFAESGMNG
jgi:ribosome-binding protein aMBF1 (putative translation factor)